MCLKCHFSSSFFTSRQSDGITTSRPKESKIKCVYTVNKAVFSTIDSPLKLHHITFWTHFWVLCFPLLLWTAALYEGNESAFYFPAFSFFKETCMTSDDLCSGEGCSCRTRSNSGSHLCGKMTLPWYWWDKQEMVVLHQPANYQSKSDTL